MVANAKCTLCGKELKDASGLAGHMRLMHKPRTVDDGTVEALREDVSELRQVVEHALASAGSGEKETAAMPSVQEFMHHCDQCEVHGAAIRQWLQEQLAALTIDDLKRLLRERGATLSALMPNHLKISGDGSAKVGLAISALGDMKI